MSQTSMHIYVPVARRPQPPPSPPRMVWVHPGAEGGGGWGTMHPVCCPTVLPTCVLPNPFPRKGERGGGDHRPPTHPSQGRGCTVGSYREGGGACTVTLCYLLTGGRVGTIDPPHPSHRRAGGLVQSHCATFYRPRP